MIFHCYFQVLGLLVSYFIVIVQFGSAESPDELIKSLCSSVVNGTSQWKSYNWRDISLIYLLKWCTLPVLHLDQTHTRLLSKHIRWDVFITFFWTIFVDALYNYKVFPELRWVSIKWFTCNIIFCSMCYSVLLT